MPGRRRSATALLAFALGAGAGCQTDWGDEELLGQLASATPQTVRNAMIGSSRRDLGPLDPELLQGLLAEFDEMSPAETIGRSSEWITYCEIQLDVEPDGEFLIRLGTRPSIFGAPVAILRDRRPTNPRIAFYDGASMLAWLEARGLCSAPGESEGT